MKHLSLAAIAFLASVGTAAGQEPSRSPLSRADIHFVLGWQNLEPDARPTRSGIQWINSILWGGGGAGWYWTDHLKTQIDFGAGTEGDQYRYGNLVIDGQTVSSFSRLTLRQRGVAVAQQYQFFRNRWFHPYVGGGASIAQVTRTERYEPISIYDSATRTSRLAAPGRSDGPEVDTTVKPFGTLGFKAYLSRRAFFTSDMRMMVDHGVDEVLFRLGFGVDF